MEQCYEFTRTGTCRYGKNCKYMHKSQDKTQKICVEFQNTGKCSFNGNCKYRHLPKQTQGSSSKWTKSKSSSMKAEDSKDVSLFIKRLRNADPARISQTISQFQNLWNEAWLVYYLMKFRVSSHLLQKELLELLIITLAKVPFSSQSQPPPISACSNTVERYLKSYVSNSNPESIVKQAEVALNVVIRLLKYEWSESRSKVQEGIEAILCSLQKILSSKFKSHRRIIQKVSEKFEELEKPWAITLKTTSTIIKINDATESNISSNVLALTTPVLHTAFNWKEANLKWLLTPEYFLPPNLPIMKVPGDRSSGVYDSVDNYFDTVCKLWVGLTFGEGHNALSPCCKKRDKDKECGHVLWPVSVDGIDSICSGLNKTCQNKVDFVCPNKFHDYALCTSCVLNSRKKLCGPPSKQSSTHLYDADVEKCNYDGTLFVKNFKSRKPPLVDIHWKTTRRLSAPNLVAVFKVSSRGEALVPSSQIIWGDITAHNRNDSRDESAYRSKGKIAINIFEVHQEKANFQSGDAVVILDCQTFVPEFLPVLNALETQRKIGIPFQNGALINLSRNLNGNSDQVMIESSYKIML